MAGFFSSTEGCRPVSSEGFTKRRRVTVIELVVVVAVAALLAGIIIPVVLDDDTDSERADALAEVQGAVRSYNNQFDTYPTFGATPSPDQIPSGVWQPGEIPGEDSVPAFAGINFDATAAREGQTPVRFYPDVIVERPRHARTIADDGTQRWRIDRSGAVSIELDDRSY